MVEFNVNHYVRARLTPLGHKIHRANFEKLFEGSSFTPVYTPPKEDVDGWSKWQMHDLMNTFGGCLYSSVSIPFETTIQIEIEQASAEKLCASLSLHAEPKE